MDIQKAIDKAQDAIQFTFLTDGRLNQVPTEMSTIWNKRSFLGIPFYEKVYKQGGILKSQLGTKLLIPHKDYLGIPYKQDGDYDYFEAHPENMPTKPEEH